MTTQNTMGYQAYQKNKYETASPHRLIAMLYEGAIRFGKHAKSLLEENDHQTASEFILKVQNIIYELISSLDEQQGGEVAQNLKNLYLYMIEELIQANIKKEAQRLDGVLDMLSELKQAWDEIGKGGSLGKQYVSG